MCVHPLLILCLVVEAMVEWTPAKQAAGRIYHQTEDSYGWMCILWKSFFILNCLIYKSFLYCKRTKALTRMVQKCLLIIFGQTVFLFFQQLAERAWPCALLFWDLVHLLLIWPLLQKCQCWDSPSVGFSCALPGQEDVAAISTIEILRAGFSYGWFVGNLEFIC